MNLPSSGIPPELGAHGAAVAERTAAELADGLPEAYSSRILHPDDQPALDEFRQEVLADLSDPDFYRREAEPPNFVGDHLGRLGLSAGIFHDGRLAACAVLNLPRPGDVNRGRDLLPEEELPFVAYAASAMVAPGQRGRGLHHRLIAWRVALAGALGRWHVLAHAYPGNHQSWAHLATHGLHGKRLVTVGGGLVRLLAHRDLRCQPALDVSTVELAPVSGVIASGGRFEQGLWLWGRCWAEGRPFALFGRPLASSVQRLERTALA